MSANNILKFMASHVVSTAKPGDVALRRSKMLEQQISNLLASASHIVELVGYSRASAFSSNS
jgi:hypothetical protein